MTTEPSGNAESPSLDAKLALVDSETESDEVVTPINKEKDTSNRELTEINTGVQDEGQAGSNPGKQDEGQARSNPGNAVEFQPQPSHVVHAGPNLEPMDLAVSDAFTQQNPEQMDEEFTTTAYPNVQENLKLSTEDQVILKEPEEEPEKTNVESEVQSMVTVPIHQDTSLVPPMTTPVIDLIMSQSDSLTVHASLPTSTATTTTRSESPRTILVSPPQPNILTPPFPRAYGAPRAPGASRPSQMHPPPYPPSTDTSRGNQQQGSGALNYLLNDDSILDEQVHLSDDKDTGNDHLPKSDLRKDWWKPLPEEERPVTPKPTWTNPSSNVSDVENNWASALVSAYEPPSENSLLAKTGDMMTFMNSYCQKVNKIMLTQADFEGQAYVIKAESDCHSTTALGGPPGSRLALSISKMKAASYPNFGLELLVPEQMWIHEEVYIERHDSSSHRREVRKHMRIISVLSESKPIQDTDIEVSNEIYKFSDGTSTRILEALDYRVKEFKIKRLNPDNDTYNGNPDKEILLTIDSNLITSRSLKDLEVQVKMEMEIPRSSGVYFITACSYLTDTSNDLMSQAKDGERPQVDDQRLDLADDLKEAQVHISREYEDEFEGRSTTLGVTLIAAIGDPWRATSPNL
ncbi:hypothetical protein Tco_0339370 [Tanacetum coccineum]